MTEQQQVKKEKGIFVLKGLSNKSNPEKMYATVDLPNEDWFHAPIDMSVDRKIALWEYCKNSGWKDLTCTIEHDGLYQGGIPINPTLTQVQNF